MCFYNVQLHRGSSATLRAAQLNYTGAGIRIRKRIEILVWIRIGNTAMPIRNAVLQTSHLFHRSVNYEGNDQTFNHILVLFCRLPELVKFATCHHNDNVRTIRES
jgi:hypothetical protein